MEYFGEVRWCRDDLYDVAMRELGYDVISESNRAEIENLVDDIMNECINSSHLEDHMIEAGWEYLHILADELVSRRG